MKQRQAAKRIGASVLEIPTVIGLDCAMEKRPVKPPHRNPHAPRFKLPHGACDTHLHIYGPFDRYPLVEERGYDPDPHSTLDDYLKTHRAVGLERP